MRERFALIIIDEESEVKVKKVLSEISPLESPYRIVGGDLDLSQTLIEAFFYSDVINTAIYFDKSVKVIAHSSLM